MHERVDIYQPTNADLLRGAPILLTTITALPGRESSGHRIAADLSPYLRPGERILWTSWVFQIQEVSIDPRLEQWEVISNLSSDYRTLWTITDQRIVIGARFDPSDAPTWSYGWFSSTKSQQRARSTSLDKFGYAILVKSVDPASVVALAKRKKSVAIGYQVEGRIHGLAAVIASPDEGFYNAIQQCCGRRITGTGQIGTGRRAFDWSPLAQVEAR